jgi:hypothetical protein
VGEKALAEAPSHSEEVGRDWIQQQVENLVDMGERSAQVMDSEDTVAEHENILDAGDGMVFAEANEHEVPMLAPMREEPDDDELVDVKQTTSRRNSRSAGDKWTIGY